MEQAKEPSFEEAITRLEAIAAEMEQGNLPIEKMVDDFEKGAKLAKLCRAKLDALEKKIELLTRDDGAQGEWRDVTHAGAGAATANEPPETHETARNGDDGLFR